MQINTYNTPVPTQADQLIINLTCTAHTNATPRFSSSSNSGFVRGINVCIQIIPNIVNQDLANGIILQISLSDSFCRWCQLSFYIHASQIQLKGNQLRIRNKNLILNSCQNRFTVNITIPESNTSIAVYNKHVPSSQNHESFFKNELRGHIRFSDQTFIVNRMGSARHSNLNAGQSMQTINEFFISVVNKIAQLFRANRESPKCQSDKHMRLWLKISLNNNLNIEYNEPILLNAANNWTSTKKIKFIQEQNDKYIEVPAAITFEPGLQFTQNNKALALLKLKLEMESLQASLSMKLPFSLHELQFDEKGLCKLDAIAKVSGTYIGRPVSGEAYIEVIGNWQNHFPN